MRCPVCRFENIEGEDYCVDCGADLAGRDVPEGAPDFSGLLLGEHLDALGLARAVTIAPDASAAAALERMGAEGVDCLLVVDRGALVGILTDRDAVLKVAGHAREVGTVGALMTRDPVVLRHDDTLAVAINKMAVGGFRHIPIVEGGTPQGVVAASDQ